jgi:bifunctional protein TilS/HprT
MQPTRARRARPTGADPILELLPHELVRFAHNSERQFAKLLDFYGIVWDYEPRTFTLETDRDGNPVQAFTPDFYLPAYDLFIEITTLNQKLVTKKNRKARRLQEQFPDVSIKVFYQRDYLRLLVKYGLEPPSQLAEHSESTEPLTLDLRPDAPSLPHADAAAESA